MGFRLRVDKENFGDMMVIQYQINHSSHGRSSMLVVIEFLVDRVAVKEYRPYKPSQSFYPKDYNRDSKKSKQRNLS